ncbi:lysine exporter LysO family protein [Archaeoglobales archaeon]|nr:MAG: lysine exporter LysO family protein [Archaeoglobales archaeon]
MFVAIILLILLAGIFLGFQTKDFTFSFSGEIIHWILILFVLLIGIDLGLMESKMERIRQSWKFGSVIAIGTVFGSMFAGLLIHFSMNIPLILAISVAAGMGWYSLTGPFLAKTFGAFAGALGFTSNFLREVFTFILYPKLRDKTAGISIGGATTMDTTLPLIARLSGSENALIAFIHGFFISILIPVLLTLLSASA